MIGLLFQLAPIIAGVLVEYSPPVQIENSQILCVKAHRHIQQQGKETRILKSEYFLAMLNDRGAEVTSTPLEIGQDYFCIEEFTIRRIDTQTFALKLMNKELMKEWEVKITGLQLAYQAGNGSKIKYQTLNVKNTN